MIDYIDRSVIYKAKFAFELVSVSVPLVHLCSINELMTDEGLKLK